MTTVRLVAAPGRRVRMPDGSVLPIEGIDADLDTDLYWRRQRAVGDVVLASAEVGLSTADAPAEDAVPAATSDESAATAAPARAGRSKG